MPKTPTAPGERGRTVYIVPLIRMRVRAHAHGMNKLCSLCRPAGRSFEFHYPYAYTFRETGKWKMHMDNGSTYSVQPMQACRALPHSCQGCMYWFSDCSTAVCSGRYVCSPARHPQATVLQPNSSHCHRCHRDVSLPLIFDLSLFIDQ